MNEKPNDVTVIISRVTEMDDSRVGEYIEANALPGDQITVINDGDVYFSSVCSAGGNTDR